MAYWVTKAILSPVLRLFFRIRVEGAENLPSEGAAILASNHISFCDSIFLPLVLRRRVTFVAKAEYFDNRRTAWFFRAVGQIPIRREGGPASVAAMAAAGNVLRRHELLAIYPEGTRSPDGRLYRGHTGVARLALEHRVPVIPVAMVGTREAQPIGQALPTPFMPITVRIGEPLWYWHLAGADHHPDLLRKITDDVMFELRELSGQSYVDCYAKRGETTDDFEPETVGMPHDGLKGGGAPR